jgi:hypothetical protein
MWQHLLDHDAVEASTPSRTGASCDQHEFSDITEDHDEPHAIARNVIESMPSSSSSSLVGTPGWL